MRTPVELAQIPVFSVLSEGRMGARILYRDSQGRDGSVDLDPRAPVYVGRALDCAIRTDDAMVSRKHSMIRMEQNRFYVEDLGSSNGTHVNDVRVTKQSLNHNDVVRCGSMWLRYVEDGPLVPVASGKRGAGTSRYDGQSAPVEKQSGQELFGTGGAQGGAFNGGSTSGQTPNVAKPAAPSRGPVGAVKEESSVVVDLSAAPPMSDEFDKLMAQVERQNRELEELQARFDREAAEGKRARAESVTLRDRLEELKKAQQDRDDMIVAHGRVADELRDELRHTKDELGSARDAQSTAIETVAARDRQLERIQNDVGRLKDELEDRDRQLAEVQRTKDDGWKKLNDQLAEIEHLREVINEQERMLEERRVGLVSQEEVIKELRADKEQMTRQQAQLRAERDELRSDEGRHLAQIAAIDEENKRLSEILAQLQSQSASGRAAEASERSTARLTEDLKQARVDVRKLESDRNRLEEIADRADAEVERLERRVAELEVELRTSAEARDVASSSQSVAREALAKAEVARHKAAEEALEAAKARDVAMSTGDELRRELDRAKKRIRELEEGGGKRAQTAVENLEEAQQELEEALRRSEERAADAERQLKTLIAERDAAQVEARSYKTGSFVLDVVDGDDPVTNRGSNTDLAADAIARLDKFSSLAEEIFEDINDVLSDLRNNALLAQGEFADLIKGAANPEEAEAVIADAMEALVGSSEDAKGILRRLKELS